MSFIVNGYMVTLIHIFYIVLINLRMIDQNFIRIFFFFLKNFFSNYRLPWDQYTMKGWMAESILNFFIIASYFLSVLSLLTLFISICKYHNAFYKMFKHQLISIDAETSSRSFPNNRLTMLLNETIFFHGSAKE